MTTRIAFREEIERLESQTLRAFDLVSESLGHVLEALEHRDVELAARIVTEDDRVDGLFLEVHDGILYLLARQAPVATDLRLVASLIQVISRVERMGDQCVNIAKLIPLAEATVPVDRPLVDLLIEMGRDVKSELWQARESFARRDLELAENLAVQDLRVNELNRACFRRALEIGSDRSVREWAMHMVQVARCLERIGDNAVDISEQAAFVVTGLFREFTDASHPDSLAGEKPTPATD